MTEFNFEPKRILKHKNHVTLNEGEQMDETVQHLKMNEDKEFVELSSNEAAKKYGSKKLVRDLDFNSRDGLQMNKDKGLNKTPEWFDYIIPTIDWDASDTFLYELDHLWMNLFFVRELYGSKGTGREQIIQLNKLEESEGLGLDVLCQLDYNTEKDSFDSDEADGFIEVEIVFEECDGGREYDVNTDFKHSYFGEDDQHLASGLKEILTGICLKHGYDGEQLVFRIVESESEIVADIKDKDFKVRFSKNDFVSESISPWIRELLVQDGCPLNMQLAEVNE